MNTIITWFRLGDSVIVERSTVLRVAHLEDDWLRLAVESPSGDVTGGLTVGRDWTLTVHGLELRHDGISPGRNPTLTKVGIEFRDLDEVDVRLHSMRGKPFHPDETPLGTHRPARPWWRLPPPGTN